MCLICAALFCYFFYHIYQGNHGLHAQEDMVRKAVQLKSGLERLQQQSNQLTKAIKQLNSDAVSLHYQSDLGDILSRQHLQYAKPGELVLFHSTDQK